MNEVKARKSDRNKRRRRAVIWYNRYLWRRRRASIMSRKTQKARPKAIAKPVMLPTPVKRVVKITAKRTKYVRPARRAKGNSTYKSPYTKSSTLTRKWYHYSGWALPLSQQPNTSVRTSNFSRSKTGRYLPNWRAVIRAGGNATTAFSAWMSAPDYSEAEIKFYHDYRINQFNPWVSSYTRDNFVNYINIDAIGSHAVPGVAQKAQDQAAIQLVKKIHQARHQLQGGVILGQIDKTARLLIGTAKDLKQGVFSYLAKAVGIRRGKGSNRSKRKAIANSYLEATFGWQPLLYDAKDLAKTLGRLSTEVDKTYLKAVGEWAEQSAQSSSVVPGVGGMYARVNENTYTQSRVVYRGTLRGQPYELGKPPLERIISMSGFDLRSFVPTMWELVPFSFLVDYFTNIGDCLLSWTADTDLVKVLWRTQTTETVRETRISPLYDYSLGQLKANLGTNGRSYSGSKRDGLSTVIYRTVSRDGAQVPLLVPKLTGLDLPWRQFANIGALIQNFSKR